MPPLQLSPTERAVLMPFISETPAVTSIAAAPAIVANKLKGDDKKFRVLQDDKYARSTVDGQVVHRIQALKRIERIGAQPDIMPGEIGGYVLHEGCLSQEGTCWVADDAIVTGRIEGDAEVSGSAYVAGNAVVSGYASVSGMAYIGGSLSNDGLLGSGSVLIDSAMVTDSCRVLGGDDTETVVSEFSTLSGACNISAGVKVRGASRLHGRVQVIGDVEISGASELEGDLLVACPEGSAKMHNEAVTYWDKERHHVPLVLDVPAGCESLVDYAEKEAGDRFTARGTVERVVMPYYAGRMALDVEEASVLLDAVNKELRRLSS